VTEDLHALIDWSGLIIIELDECYDLLLSQPVGRLGLIEGAEPLVLPVNYLVDGRSLVFRTGQGSKLSAALMQHPVCLEIDGWDDFDHTGWSVLVKGFADVVDEATEVARLDLLPTRPWSSPELRRQWIRVVPEEVTGRRIATPAGPWFA